jgi:hypothetical protein
MMAAHILGDSSRFARREKEEEMINRAYLAVLPAVWSVTAWGGESLTPITQARRVEAYSFDYNSPIPGSDHQEAVAPDFSLFDVTLDSNYYMGHGSASQLSEILTSNLAGHGTASGGGSSFDNGGGGSSLFDVTFEVTDATPFTLSGQLLANSIFALGTATAHVTLDAALIESVSGLETQPFSVSGILAAGQHHLVVDCVAASPPGPGFASSGYDFELALVPEPSCAVLLLASALGRARSRR